MIMWLSKFKYLNYKVEMDLSTKGMRFGMDMAATGEEKDSRWEGEGFPGRVPELASTPLAEWRLLRDGESPVPSVLSVHRDIGSKKTPRRSISLNSGSELRCMISMSSSIGASQSDSSGSP